METRRKALITGASRGLGYALAESLAHLNYSLIITGRNPETLKTAHRRLSEFTEVIAKSGDIRDEVHLLELADTLELHNWQLDLVANNASELGVSPMVNLLDHPVEDLHKIFHTNVIGPVSLLQKLTPHLAESARIINISSDAAVEHYETWGAYGGSKSALDHISAVLGKEYPQYSFYAFDPGDMKTEMHQVAFPGEDISDRPLPVEQAVPALLELIDSELPGGRYSVGSFKTVEA